MNGDGLAPASCIRGVPETIRHTAGGFFVAITETSPSAADNMEGVLNRTATYSTTVFDWYSETDTDEGFKLDVEHLSTPSPVDLDGGQPIKLGQVVLEAETTDITGVKHVYTKVMAADPTAGAAVPPGAKRLGFAFNTLYEKLPAVATPQRLALEFAVRDAIADDIGISKERVIFRGFEEKLPDGRRLQESVSLGTNTMVKFDVMPGVSSEKTPQGVAVTASGLMGAPDGVAWDHLKKLWEAPCDGCGDYKLGLPVGGPDGTGAVCSTPPTPTTPTLPRSRSTAARPATAGAAVAALAAARYAVAVAGAAALAAAREAVESAGRRRRAAGAAGGRRVRALRAHADVPDHHRRRHRPPPHPVLLPDLLLLLPRRRRGAREVRRQVPRRRLRRRSALRLTLF